MVIFHLDLDCFYCQVEMKRLSLDRTRPMAVRQWTGLVAVNYPARDRGVKRFMRLQEARRACPEINFVHVPTYGPGDENWQYYLEPDKQTHKVSLDVYRAASQSIFTLIAERFPLLIVQKASIDEAYIDIGRMLTAGSDEDGCVNEEEAEESVQSSIQGTVLVECNPQDGLPEELGRGNNSWLQAMDIARSIRKCLWEELQFTCSIGISPNKTLSKLLSSSNKPDKQSILLPSLIDKYMATVPLQKIRQFGGKLGEQIRQTFGVENAGELQRFSLEELSSGLQSKEQAKFLFNICRGICNDAVESNSCHSKSITSAKALQPPHNQSIAAMEGTLRLLASDIYQRLDRLRLERKEWPKTLTISSTNATTKVSKSRSFKMAENHQISSMLKLFEFLQSSCHSAAIQFPVSWMNFSCHSFVPVSNSSSIEKFLIKGKRPAPDEPPQNIDFNVDLTTAVAEDSGNESPVHLIESSDDENVARNNTVKENESLLFKCPRNGCKRMLCKDDPRDTQEHLDFHMAEDLASGRVQSGSSSGPKKQKLLTRFFKPVPPKQQQEQHQ